MNRQLQYLGLLVLALMASSFTVQEAAAQARLRNIARIKGQEENVLRGVGLVVGLNGTGESNDPATMKALARALDIMGNPVSTTGRIDETAFEALKNVKNVAYVMVTATVPATGARRGDKLDCQVSALNGKSLEGGMLAFAALQGPNTQDRSVFALCHGSLQLDDIDQPMVAHIHNGCQMEQDIFTKFVTEDGWVTIVLDKNHADFGVANEIAAELEKDFVDTYLAGVAIDGSYDVEERHVFAINAANIRVKVPELYENDVVEFIGQLMDKQVHSFQVEPEARVVINPRTGSIVISGDVEIGDIVFTHRNVVVETGVAAEFLQVSPGVTNQPKLDRLVEALANLKVPAHDVIEIIRGIDRMGKLHARLIIL